MLRPTMTPMALLAAKSHASQIETAPGSDNPMTRVRQLIQLNFQTCPMMKSARNITWVPIKNRTLEITVTLRSPIIIFRAIRGKA